MRTLALSLLLPVLAAAEPVTKKTGLLEVIRSGAAEYHVNPKADSHDDPKDISTLSPEESRKRPAAPLLLVANKHSDTLCFVDPRTLKVQTTIATGHNPHEIVVTPDQRFAYLSNYKKPGNTISVIDLVQRKHIKQISTGSYGRIHGTAVSPDGRHAYFTAGQSGHVIEVDTQTHTVTRQIPTHGTISHMVYVSADGSKLYRRAL